MHRIFVPARGLDDWRRLLADPDLHWRDGKSAKELALIWEAAQRTRRGLPPEIAAALDKTGDLRGAALVLAVPEHRVGFAGGGHPSQNDLWALLRVGKSGLVSLTVEAKAGEELGDLVGDWLRKAEEGSKKPARLDHLRRILGLDAGEPIEHIRYQLLHRTASALKEAQRASASAAAMIVQSFDAEKDRPSFGEFCVFGRLMGADVRMDSLARCTRATEVPLWLGWVNSKPVDRERSGRYS